MRDRADQILGQAQTWFDRGLYTPADLYLWQLVEFIEPRADALNLLGRIAMAVGEPAIAAARFRRAMDVDPYFKPASKNLKKAEQEAAAPPKPGTDRWRRAQRDAGQSEGYLVIRAWGAGFWSDVDHVLGNLLLAEITGRTPIVAWGESSRWAMPGTESAWDLYFEPVSSLTLDNVRAESGPYFPDRWSAANFMGPDLDKWGPPETRFAGPMLLNRPERVVVADFCTPAAQMRHWLPADHPLHGAAWTAVYRDLVRRYLRLKPDIEAEVRAFAQEVTAGGPTAAIHIRGTDKSVEISDLGKLNAACREALDRALAERSDLRIFLLTDTAAVVSEFRQRYGDRLVTADCQRGAGQTGVHFLEGLPVDRRRLGIEVIRDAYAAAACERFIGIGMSNVALAVQHLKDWAPGACTLVGLNLHERTPVSIYVV